MFNKTLLPVGSVIIVKDRYEKYLIIKNFIEKKEKMYLCLEIDSEKIKSIKVVETKIEKVLFLGMQTN